MSDRIGEAVKARDDARGYLAALNRKLTVAEKKADEARDQRNDAIVRANTLLTPREIAEITGMPSEQYIRRLLTQGRRRVDA